MITRPVIPLRSSLHRVGLAALLALAGCTEMAGGDSGAADDSIPAAADGSATDESGVAVDEQQAAADRPDPFEPRVEGASEDADDPLSREWTERTYREVMTALAEGAGIRMPAQVPIVVATNEAALKRRRAFSQSLEEHEGLTYGLDLMADLLLGGGILGRYFPDEKVFYLFSDNILEYDDSVDQVREFAWAIMAHEMVHAYDDQVYDSVPTPDEAILEMGKPGKIAEVGAMMALLEGRATYAAELACEQAGVAKLPVRTMDDVANTQMMSSDGSIEQDVGAGLANFLARGKLAQYVYGRTFARKAFEFGGEKFFAHVFGSLPISMAEVEDFDRFKVRWAADLAAQMEAEENAIGD